MSIRNWRCYWSSAGRRCFNYIWVINNFMAHQGATYIRDFSGMLVRRISIHDVLFICFVRFHWLVLYSSLCLYGGSDMWTVVILIWFYLNIRLIYFTDLYSIRGCMNITLQLPSQKQFWQYGPFRRTIVHRKIVRTLYFTEVRVNW